MLFKSGDFLSTEETAKRRSVAFSAEEKGIEGNLEVSTALIGLLIGGISVATAPDMGDLAEGSGKDVGPDAAFMSALRSWFFTDFSRKLAWLVGESILGDSDCDSVSLIVFGICGDEDWDAG